MRQFEIVTDIYEATQVSQPGPYVSIEKDGILFCKVYGQNPSEAADRGIRITHLLNLYGDDGVITLAL